jgi:hypothetical protein
MTEMFKVIQLNQGLVPIKIVKPKDILPMRRRPAITVILDRESKACSCIRLSLSIAFVRL